MCRVGYDVIYKFSWNLDLRKTVLSYTYSLYIKTNNDTLHFNAFYLMFQPRRHDWFIAGKITFFKVVRYFLYDNCFATAIYDYPIIGTYSNNNLTKF